MKRDTPEALRDTLSHEETTFMTHRKIRRRDGTGHLDPAYEAMLRAGSGPSSRPSDNRAFLGRPWSTDPLAEERGGEFVASVTSGQDEAQEILDRTLVEEQGGPFVETSEKTELSYE